MINYRTVLADLQSAVAAFQRPNPSQNLHRWALSHRFGLGCVQSRRLVTNQSNSLTAIIRTIKMLSVGMNVKSGTCTECFSPTTPIWEESWPTTGSKDTRSGKTSLSLDSLRYLLVNIKEKSNFVISIQFLITFSWFCSVPLRRWSETGRYRTGRVGPGIP